MASIPGRGGGSRKPDGKPPRVERVAFTKPAAERISKAVLAVERSGRDSEPINFGVRIQDIPQPAKVFRICTYTATATWTKGLSKVVAFKYQTTTPNTVTATNLFADVSTSSGGVNCAIAKEGTAWFLIAAECLTQAPEA